MAAARSTVFFKRFSFCSDQDSLVVGTCAHDADLSKAEGRMQRSPFRTQGDRLGTHAGCIGPSTPHVLPHGGCVRLCTDLACQSYFLLRTSADAEFGPSRQLQRTTPRRSQSVTRFENQCWLVWVDGPLPRRPLCGCWPQCGDLPAPAIGSDRPQAVPRCALPGRPSGNELLETVQLDHRSARQPEKNAAMQVEMPA